MIADVSSECADAIVTILAGISLDYDIDGGLLFKMARSVFKFSNGSDAERVEAVKVIAKYVLEEAYVGICDRLDEFIKQHRTDFN